MSERAASFLLKLMFNKKCGKWLVYNVVRPDASKEIPLLFSHNVRCLAVKCATVSPETVGTQSR